MSNLLNHWPLWFICLAMIVAAVIDGWKLKVPNWLTFPLILSGWLLGLLHSFNVSYGLDQTGIGTIWAALAGTALGFILLYPVHAIGGMGAGDVKMQMGFGSWVGAYYGWGVAATETSPGIPNAMSIIWWAFCLAVVIGGVLAIFMILIRGQYRQNMQNTRDIIGDLFEATSVEDVADKAKARKPRMHLLPYGIPLCLGFVSYLLFL